MNMIIPFIALFLPPVALGETKLISNIAPALSGVSNMIGFNNKNIKRNKEYDQTRFVFYIRWGATMQLIIDRFKTMFSSCKTILSISMHGKKMNYKNWFQVILEKRIFCQDSTSITVLIKMRCVSYWSRF